MQTQSKISWKSPSNIALVKYWGKKGFQIPSNASLSFTLSNCHTTTELRWESSSTAVFWEKASLDYDSTLGFPDLAGFRCGVCYEFPLYDLDGRNALTVRERPLICMDVTVTSPVYMNLGLGEAALEAITDLRVECERYQGDFTLLWHNDHLVDEESRELYRQILAV